MSKNTLNSLRLELTKQVGDLERLEQTVAELLTNYQDNTTSFVKRMMDKYQKLADEKKSLILNLANSIEKLELAFTHVNEIKKEVVENYKNITNLKNEIDENEPIALPSDDIEVTIINQKKSSSLPFHESE